MGTYNKSEFEHDLAEVELSGGESEALEVGVKADSGEEGPEGLARVSNERVTGQAQLLD